jgi:hypothetical protein
MDLARFSGNLNARIRKPFVFLDYVPLMVHHSHGSCDNARGTRIPSSGFKVEGGAGKGVPGGHASTLPAGTDRIGQRHCS